MKKLFISDVDNTLVTEENPHFSKKLKEMLKKIENSNDEFVLCSGRPTINLIDIALELQQDNINLKYVSGFNGAEVYDMLAQKTIINNGLTKEQVTHICEYLNKEEYKYIIFDQKCIRTNLPDNYWTIRESRLSKKPIAKLLDTFAASPKVLLIVDGKENIQIQNNLKQALPEYDIFDSAPHFIEIVKKGVNKATPLKEIAELEDFKIKNTYGLGDSGNDIELIKQAGTGIAVENAREDIKSIADIIVSHVENDGIANYLEKIL